MSFYLYAPDDSGLILPPDFEGTITITDGCLDAKYGVFLPDEEETTVANVDEPHNYAGGPASFVLSQDEMHAIALLGGYVTYDGPNPLSNVVSSIEKILGETEFRNQISAQATNDYGDDAGGPVHNFYLRFSDNWKS